MAGRRLISLRQGRELLPGSSACYAVGKRHEGSVLHEADVTLHRGVELGSAGPRDALHVDLTLTFSGACQHVNAVVTNVGQTAAQSVQVAEEEFGEVALTPEEQAVMDVQLEEATGQLFPARNTRPYPNYATPSCEV